jgi:hypothetical protein
MKKELEIFREFFKEFKYVAYLGCFKILLLVQNHFLFYFIKSP